MECPRELAAYSLPAHKLSWAPYPVGWSTITVLLQCQSGTAFPHLSSPLFFSFSTLCGQGVYVYIPQVDPVPNEDSQLI